MCAHKSLHVTLLIACEAEVAKVSMLTCHVADES